MYKTPSLQSLLEAGVHFGHQIRRGHPRMKPYIYGARDGVHVIDLTLSEKHLKEACEFVFELGKRGGTLLFVGTKKQAKPIVEELAKRVNAPHLSERWVGGFFTNFEEIQKNIKKLKELKEQKTKGGLSRYTKKEQLLLDRKMAKLEKNFGGVLEMSQIPDAVFIIDAVAENTAVKEANAKDVKVVAIADSNSNPGLMDYPIPGNDDAIKSIRIISEAVAAAYEEGKKQASERLAKETKMAEEKAKKEAEEEMEVKVSDEIAEAEERIEKQTLRESERVVE